MLSLTTTSGGVNRAAQKQAHDIEVEVGREALANGMELVAVELVADPHMPGNFDRERHMLAHADGGRSANTACLRMALTHRTAEGESTGRTRQKLKCQQTLGPPGEHGVVETESESRANRFT